MRPSTVPFVPPTALRQVENLTPCETFQAMKMAQGRRYFDTLVIKGTFDLVPGRLEWAEEPRAVVVSDVLRDEENPERSSLLSAGEVLLHKPTTDVFVSGTASAPDGRPTERWLTSVRVSDGDRVIANSTAEVTGPRTFQHRRMRGWTLSDPAPTTEVPIAYELAYGGAFVEREPAEDAPPLRVHEANPSGTGFFDEATLDRAREYTAPQWQLADHPVVDMNRDVPLAGFGPIARPWTSRLQHAGTYDEAWRERTRSEAAMGLPPDYPADFDARFFQAAHPALICPAHLRGDETLGLAGLVTGHGLFTTRLPGIQIGASLRAWGHDWVQVHAPLDTVHVDVDAAKVELCWRLTLNLYDEILAAVITEEPL